MRHAGERGDTTIMVTAVLLLMLFFASMAFEYVSYQIARGEVSALAKAAAAHAANFLPEPKIACAEALKAANNLSLGGLGQQNQIRILVNAGKANGSEPGRGDYYVVNSCSQFCEKSASANCASPLDKIDPPLYSLTVEISRNFLPLVNLINVNGASPFTVTAQSSAQLAPTDVVLVIDNSNSVVSPAKPRAAGTPAPSTLWTSGGPFELWNDAAGRRNVDGQSLKYSDTDLSEVTRAEMRVRQCFGEVNEELKTAALKALDILSSSASFRVGVVHTLNPGGEFADATVRLASDSYARMHSAPWAKDVLLPKPQGGETFARVGYPESRCAALLSVFQLPAHPLSSSLNVDTTTNSLPVLETQGDALAKLNYLPNFAAQDVLLPRHLIWIKNSGDFLESGEPNYFASFSLFQRAIERASGLLQNAPARADGQSVKNRVILVFTDGLERPGVDFDIPQEGNGRTFNYVQNVAVAAAAATPPPVAAEPLQENFCTAFKQANQSSGQIRLGVIRYGVRDRDIWSNQDPTSYLRDLPGHAGQASDFASFNQACSTDWQPGSGPGTFLVESKANTYQVASQEYLGVVVPLVVRALLEPQIGLSSETIKRN